MAIRIIFLLGVLLVAGFSIWQRSSALAPILEPLPQDSMIQVYFNHSQAAVYREPYRQQERWGDDLEEVIVDTIQSARSSIDIAIHELHLPRVALALRDRHQAGVAVRVILEHDYSQPWSSITPQMLAAMEERDRTKYLEFLQLADTNQNGQLEPSEAQTFDSIFILQQAGVPLIDDTADGSKGSSLMHHKFVVVDKQVVLSGSVNYSISEVHGDFLSTQSTGNANHLLKITSPALAQVFEQEFAEMWGNGVGTSPTHHFGLQKRYRPPQQIALAPGSTITVQFSPTSSAQSWYESVNGLIGTTLDRASRSVDMALFVFSEQWLSNILAMRHQQGVRIRALIDPSFIYRDYSEALDMLGMTLPSKECRVEEGNQPWTGAIATVGTPQLAEGDLLHHKFAIVDQHIVISGSQNWSAAANNGNDENLLVIDNATVAAHFQREFERLYQGASLGVPDWLYQKAADLRSRCRI
ncbi:MAG: competence protein ComE [Leptolyngbyaceae cyanobacterium SL_7_1]|nr:competence protein ComE [Leptolyngbyaceae cyanobacterium SL_7_1]